MDIFDQKNLKPMLIGENRPAFDSDDYIYELKLDGIRALAYLSPDGTALRNKRNKTIDNIYPELAGIHKQVKVRCILDGELAVLSNGKPDFFEVQRRSLMTNQFKIKLAADKLPACFTAFDIVYHDGEQVTALPLMERKELLSGVVPESERLAVSRVIERQGVAFFEAARDNALEGIVAKRRDSKYYFGKETKDWIRCKALLDDDFVVCGYYPNEKNTISVILGWYDTGRLVYQGHVSIGVSRPDYSLMKAAPRCGIHSGFPVFDNAVWLQPELTCTVSYMERTPSGGLRQPSFKGLRDDKTPEECVSK